MAKKIIYKKTDELIPYVNNPRKNEKAIDYVAGSIAEYGFQSPIIIDENNVIVAGHTRQLAAKKLGIKDVPCVVADDLTPEQIKGFRLADNKVAEFAEWDFDKLEIEMAELPGLDFQKFGFDEMGGLETDLDEPKEQEPHNKEIECPNCGFVIEV